MPEPDITFISADQIKAAMARGAQQLSEVAKDLSSSQEDMQRFIDKEPWGPPKLAKFFFSRRERPADRSLRYLASGVILAESYEQAQERLAEALRQRGSSATVEEFAFRSLEKPRDKEPDYGILATMRIDP